MKFYQANMYDSRQSPRNRHPARAVEPILQKVNHCVMSDSTLRLIIKMLELSCRELLTRVEAIRRAELADLGQANSLSRKFVVRILKLAARRRLLRPVALNHRLHVFDNLVEELDHNLRHRVFRQTGL